MTKMTGWDKFILALIIIGALNWGLIGFFQYEMCIRDSYYTILSISQLDNQLFRKKSLDCLIQLGR